MSGTIEVGILVGSLRKESWTRRVAQALVSVAPPALTFRWIDIGDLLPFNEDLEHDPPAPWTRLRRDVAAADAILFVTPEYNRSVPGLLKNALDIASRPGGKSVWSGKPAAVVSVSPFDFGGFGANHHLRQSLVFLDMPTMQQPEAYVAKASERVDAAGAITNDRTREIFTKYMAAFAMWAGRFKG